MRQPDGGVGNAGGGAQSAKPFSCEVGHGLVTGCVVRIALAFAGERAFARRVRRVLDGWSVWADALKSLWKRAHFQTAPLVTAASAGLGTVRWSP